MPDCTNNPASEYYADFILRYFYNDREGLYNTARTRCIHFINQEYAIIYSPLSYISDLNVADYSYAAIPKLYGLLDTTALNAAGIPQAASQPVLRATGRGVLIGFIDTGIDYTNPMFRNADGSSRILYLWDQALGNDSADSYPEPVAGFQPFFGRVFDQEQLNQALQAEDPYTQVPSRDEIGHGTFLAGIASGYTEQPEPYSGAAPEAALAVVKLKPAKQYLRDFFLIQEDVPAYQENDIMSGVSFLIAAATEARLPLVICLGAGTSQGSHEGSSPLGHQLQNLAGYPGIAAVIGAGNETGYAHHYFGSLPEEQTYDEVEIRVGAKEILPDSANGFCLELWAREPDLFSIGLVSPSGEVIERIPQSLGRNVTIPFRLDATFVTVNYINYEPGSGSQLIFLRFQNPSEGIWRLRVYPTIRATGQFHIWLPLQQFLSREVVFLKPDPDTTITDPGNAAMPLTVGAYDPVTNGIYIHSSRGFTRSGQIKPEIAAPGVNIQGPAVLPIRQSTTPRARSEQNVSPASSSGTDFRLTRMTGTSVAAAITAGAVAGIFTWAFTDRNDLTMSGAAAQSILIRGANRSPSFVYPNKEWGFGTLDLYQAFLNNRE